MGRQRGKRQEGEREIVRKKGNIRKHKGKGKREGKGKAGERGEEGKAQGGGGLWQVKRIGKEERREGRGGYEKRREEGKRRGNLIESSIYTSLEVNRLRVDFIGSDDLTNLLAVTSRLQSLSAAEIGLGNFKLQKVNFQKKKTKK